jgi:phage major head subunit gpT-like protein
MATQTDGLKSTQTRDILGYMYMQLAQEPMGWVNSLGMYIPTDQETEKHRWLGMAPVMRLWEGGRQAHKPNAYGIDVTNELYEGTIDIPVQDIQRDKTGKVMNYIDDLVRRANNHWNKLASDLIDAAESTVCYDGQFWVDTDHAESGSNQSNDISFAAATGTTPTVTEMVDAILDNIKTMYSFVDDQGEPINQDASNFLVMVPLTYWAVAQKAVKQELIASGETNVLGKSDFSLSVVMNPRLSWTTKMMCFATDTGTKSMILQDEESLAVSAKAEGSEYAHDTNHYQYGVKAGRAVAPGFWQSCCMTTFT